MPVVIIHRPGSVHRGENDVWTFTAAVGPKRGVVSIDLPSGSSENEAARAAQGLLEEAPSELQGITSTGGGGGGEGGGGVTAGGAEGGGAEHDVPIRVQDKDGD